MDLVGNDVFGDLVTWISSEASNSNDDLIGWLRNGNAPNILLHGLFYMDIHTILPDVSFSCEVIRAFFGILSQHLPDCVHFLPVEFNNEAFSIDMLVGHMNGVNLNDGESHFAIHLADLNHFILAMVDFDETEIHIFDSHTQLRRGRQNVNVYGQASCSAREL